MKKLVFVSLIIAFIHANPQANQQAFQQGRSIGNSFNQSIDQAKAPLQSLFNAIQLSRQQAEAIIRHANQVNPQTLEGCRQVYFATEFCFVNFAKELKEYQERLECKVEARAVMLSLTDPWFKAGNGYEKKNCARFVPKPTKEK